MACESTRTLLHSTTSWLNVMFDLEADGSSDTALNVREAPFSRSQGHMVMKVAQDDESGVKAETLASPVHSVLFLK